MTLAFDALPDRPGFRVRDTAEGEDVTLATDRSVAPTRVPVDELDAPVDAAVELDATELHLPVFFDPVFRRDGEVVAHGSRDGDNPRLPEATYEVDVSPPNVKLYVRVENGAPAARYAEGHVYLDVAAPDRLVVGVRSHHERPAGTVTVTDDPRDLLTAVSAFGSALKTLSPDRSWPTLRGHPPAIEFGDELDVPDAVAPPDTGVSIEVPPEYGAIFTVAPLACYLGATVEPGTEPRLVAGGTVHALDDPDLASGVRSTLEHAFALDSVVREAGFYPFRTEQSDVLEASVDLDYERLFDLPLAERTAAYLDVSREATESLLDWHYTADVAARAENAVALPSLVDELALVRSPREQAATRTLTPTPDALADGHGELARSVAAGSEQSLSVAVPADAGTPGHAWLPKRLAPGAANPTVGSYRRAFDWPQGADPLDVHVVYNDARLDGVDESAYDTHPYQETTVTASRDLSTSELREVLYGDVDFLHFVGHVTDDGMVCRDGTLDVRTLATTGVKAFFLNGCRSYEQGRALLTAGAVGGLATVDDVADDAAGRVGRAVSLLLANGFPLYAVLDALAATDADADRYAALGSGTLALRRAPGGTPVLYAFDTDEFDAGADPVPTTARSYPYGENGPGAYVTPTYTTRDAVVGDGSVTRTRFPRSELAAMLDDSPVPVVVDGDLRYTPDLSLADFE